MPHTLPAMLFRTLARACRLPIAAPPPQVLGVTEGRFAPCPATPNCVSSQADDRLHAVAPLAIRGGRDTAMAAAVAALRRERGVHIVERGTEYLYAECETPLMRFFDDLELYWDDAAGVLHVRSASRVGRSDMGVNRARVERLRARLAER